MPGLVGGGGGFKSPGDFVLVVMRVGLGGEKKVYYEIASCGITGRYHSRTVMFGY